MGIGGKIQKPKIDGGKAYSSHSTTSYGAEEGV